jgi:4-deoxy-L-threo-5-hexosulose-uronate ketol-isomerase
MTYLYPPKQIDGLTTRELRSHFLIEGLFRPGEAAVVDTGLDRMVVAGIVPAPQLDWSSDGAGNGNVLLSGRREMGIINVGATGEIVVDGRRFEMKKLECLYVGAEAKQVSFRRTAEEMAQFYVLSCPAHRAYPTKLATQREAFVTETGRAQHAARRKIFRYIHPGGLRSCQLVMGYTELELGSVWNTWPPHTHVRRSEVYLYFDLEQDSVMHFLGEPHGTRHLVVRDREAVLSPPWSIHCGVGSSNYRFVWGMAGENQVFEDMDPVELKTLR